MTFSGTYSKNDFKWTGGCIYNGKLFSFPHSKNTLLVYDISSDMFKEIDCGFNNTAEHHYGGVCPTDGIVYQPPKNTNHILKWDLKTKSCRKIEINNGQNCRYCGTVIHPDGYIYFIPEKDSLLADKLDRLNADGRNKIYDFIETMIKHSSNR